MKNCISKYQIKGDTVNEKYATLPHLEPPNNLRNMKRANTWREVQLCGVFPHQHKFPNWTPSVQ